MKTRTSPADYHSVIRRYWWLPSAALGPAALALNPAWQVNAVTTTLNAFRSGVIGLVIACVVYVLWKIDCRLNHNFRPDRTVDAVILMLGISLWLVWFSTCQMILIARDEVNRGGYPAVSNE